MSEMPPSKPAWSTAEILLTVASPEIDQNSFGTWFAAWSTSTGLDMRIGDERTFALTFGETVKGERVLVPKTSPVLNVFLDSSSGLQISSERRRTLPASGGRLLVTELSFRVTALLPGSHKLTASVYPGRELDGIPPAEVKLLLTVAEPLDGAAQVPDPSPISWPTPDLQLYVALRPARIGVDPFPEQLDIYVNCPLLLQEQKRYDIHLDRDDAAALREMAARYALNVRRGGDAYAVLRRFGMALFDVLAPEDKSSTEPSLRELLFKVTEVAATASRQLTCLIISDEPAALPWELVLPYAHIEGQDPTTKESDFLTACFVVAQWFGRLGQPLANEVPLRRLEIAHYGLHRDDLLYWQQILGGEVRATFSENTSDFEVNNPTTDVVGLHLLRYMNRSSAGEIRSVAAETDNRIEGATRNHRLSFAARRPLVTLSLVEEAAAMPQELYPIHLEDNYALLFIRAEASAVIGPRWPVAAEIDHLFYRLLYDQLYRGRRLGDAMHIARMEVASAYPRSADWLAYVLYGHPGAEPYIVIQAAAYSLFEVLEPNQDAPLQAGRKYAFRASYGVEMPAYGRVYFQPVLPQVIDPRVVVVADHLPAPLRERLDRVGSHFEKTLDLEVPENERSVTFNVWFKDGKRELDSQIVSFELIRETTNAKRSS